jgi:hypothetical protein
MTSSSGVVLGNVAYLIGAVVLAFIGGLIVWLRHRQPKSVDANVESFSRGLRALAPDASNPRGPRTPSAAGPTGVRIQPRVGVSPSAATDVTAADPGLALASTTAPAGVPPSERVSSGPLASRGDPEPNGVDLSGSDPEQPAPTGGPGATRRAGAETG